MSETAVVEEIAVAFEYSYRHEDWITPLSEVFEGLPVEGALFRLSPGTKCIWEIVLHLNTWNLDIVERIRTGRKCRPPEGPWPALPHSSHEAEWKAAQARLLAAIGDLIAFVRTCTLADLNRGPYGLADLLCRLTHNGYHIGQMTKLKEAWERSRNVDSVPPSGA